MIADERRLLPEVRSIAVNACMSTHAAKAVLLLKTVHAAVPRANLT